MERNLKTCFKCGEAKPLSEFYRHQRMADGHLNKCKNCAIKDVIKNRTENIERIRDYDRKRKSLPHRRELNRKVCAEYATNYPKRRAAQAAVRYAVRRGKLIPQPCFICGEKAEAHHPDYDAPLSVVWLCPAHHKQAHALIKVT